MKIETVVTILGVLTAIIAIMQGVDWWKKRQSKGSVDVVNSAILLLRPYQEEAELLRKSLNRANMQVRDLAGKLNDAETRANKLNNQLVEAQAELGYLRVRVEVLTQQLSEDKK